MAGTNEARRRDGGHPADPVATGTAVRALTGLVLGTVVVPLGVVLALQPLAAQVGGGLPGLVAVVTVWAVGLLGTCSVLALVVLWATGRTGAGGARALIGRACGDGLLLTLLLAEVRPRLGDAVVDGVVPAVAAVLGIAAFRESGRRPVPAGSSHRRTATALVRASAVIGVVLLAGAVRFNVLTVLPGL